MRVILIGPPGAGKGTQAAKIREKRNVAHVSTGDILRDNVKRGSEIGMRAKSFMESGRLVPDELIIEMIETRLGEKDAASGFILDGFPRTTSQAEALDRLLAEMSLALDAVVLLEISDEDVVRRLTGRRVCSSCGAIYNAASHPSKIQGVCDSCGGNVVQREDDKEAVIRNRLAVYHGQTSPVVDYYADKGLLLRVDASKAPDAAMRRLESLEIR
ncbi:MAG: adenylate kinase [Synergistaceae bacterium]|nr:adenylate kinase [Synergistaceae bacterium]